MTLVDCGAQEFRPRWRDRLWRRLGLGYPGVPRLPDPMEGFCDGYFLIETVTDFCWRDRLLILLSGKTITVSAIKTDVPIAKSYSLSLAGVLPPGHPKEPRRR